VVEVSDDGVGGADVAGGSGLRGLSDCIAALDGTSSWTASWARQKGARGDPDRPRLAKHALTRGPADATAGTPLADQGLRANASAPRFVTDSGTATVSAADPATRRSTPFPIR
jgi:hypothetical protein